MPTTFSDQSTGSDIHSENRPGLKAGWIILAVILLILGGLALFGGNRNENQQANTSPYSMDVPQQSTGVNGGYGSQSGTRSGADAGSGMGTGSGTGVGSGTGTGVQGNTGTSGTMGTGTGMGSGSGTGATSGSVGR